MHIYYALQPFHATPQSEPLVPSLTNVGPADRVIRALLGIALLALTVVGPHSLWGLVGIIPLATAAAGFCPLYRVAGVDTAHTRSAR